MYNVEGCNMLQRPHTCTGVYIVEGTNTIQHAAKKQPKVMQKQAAADLSRAAQY